MKNVTPIVVFSIALFYQSCTHQSEDQDAPKNVKASFSQKFPNAEKVKWGKENESEWEAKFNMDSKKYSANFTTNGEWSETEYEIAESAIPENIKGILDSNFTDYEIEKAEITETAEGKSYEFEIEQGEEEFEVVIDSQGLIEKKKESEENEDKGEDGEED